MKGMSSIEEDDINKTPFEDMDVINELKEVMNETSFEDGGVYELKDFIKGTSFKTWTI